MRKTKQHKKYTIKEKNEIVQAYLIGKFGQAKLLEEFDISSKSVLHRWIQQYEQFGTCIDGRGKSATGRPKTHYNLEAMSKDELIERIELLEDLKKHNWHLKSARIKYQLIDMLASKYSKRSLFRYFDCSKSGYYDWINIGRPLYKNEHKELVQQIQTLHQQFPEFGYRMICLYLKTAYNLLTTNKIVYRLMKLMNIASIIRKKKKVYPKLAKIYDMNYLKRDFTTTGPNQKWSIDISYIHLKYHTIYYLCVIKDLYDKSIISFQLAPNMSQSLVNRTLFEAFEKVPSFKRADLILHSDQGAQFTSLSYRRILETNLVIHSISYKGTCVDNAPIESFFSTLKTGVNYAYRKMTRDDAYYLIYQYIQFYNNQRPQLTIKGLTPSYFRSLAL